MTSKHELLLSVMVLLYVPEQNVCMWCDFDHRSRTMRGLMKTIQREVNSGRFRGYRLIQKHHEYQGRISGKHVADRIEENCKRLQGGQSK